MAELTEQQALKEREKYVMAFNDTMVKIWKEQILLLDVIDTGALLNSPVGIRCDKDDRITTITISQSFLEYGLWQNYGTGREVARGNPGDIGRAKMRERRPWMSRKFYASFMNIKDLVETKSKTNDSQSGSNGSGGSSSNTNPTNGTNTGGGSDTPGGGDTPGGDGNDQN